MQINCRVADRLENLLGPCLLQQLQCSFRNSLLFDVSTEIFQLQSGSIGDGRIIKIFKFSQDKFCQRLHTLQIKILCLQVKNENYVSQLIRVYKKLYHMKNGVFSQSFKFAYNALLQIHFPYSLRNGIDTFYAAHIRRSICIRCIFACCRSVYIYVNICISLTCIRTYEIKFIYKFTTHERTCASFSCVYT